MKYFLIFASILGLDLKTKNWVERNLPLGEERKISKNPENPLFFRHIKNTGMAYHKFAGEKKAILKVTGILCGVYSLLFCLALKKEGRYHHLAIPLAITLGGAWGNFYERLQKGYVTDFIYIKAKGAPIFNVADLALAFGALWMFFMELGKKKLG